MDKFIPTGATIPTIPTGAALTANLTTFMKSSSVAAKVFRVIILSIIGIIAIELLIKLYTGYQKYSKASPWLLKGTKRGNQRLVILQDPKKEGSVTLHRSNNETGGLEFSYSFWLFIDDWSHKYGSWKHIMHKGNSSSWPLCAPGIWLHPKKNTMRVYMNTFQNIGEFSDIENIPLNKWFHTVVAVRQRNLDIFVNGNLVKSHQLEGLPKQNNGDVYINSFRGFGGYISNIKYNDYYISFSEIETQLDIGPASMESSAKLEHKPPYLSHNWWANST
jgi:hypothetical protein